MKHLRLVWNNPTDPAPVSDAMRFDVFETLQFLEFAALVSDTSLHFDPETGEVTIVPGASLVDWKGGAA